MKTRKFWKRF